LTTLSPTDDAVAAYTPVADWGIGLPEMRNRDIPDVAARNDEIFLAYRDPASIVVCDAYGDLRRIVGVGIIQRPHGVTVDAEHIYVVDESLHAVHIFERSGDFVTSFGSGPSNPGFPAAGLHADRVIQPLPPFTRPTRLAVGRDGDLYISDGYGNCRIHRFSPDGSQLRHSWGSAGSSEGSFNLPHSVNMNHQGRVLVCDRENDRIQVFDSDGLFIEVWQGLHRPQAIAEASDGTLFVAEGAWDVGRVSPTLGPVDPARSRVSVLDSSGRRVGTIGPDTADVAADFVSAHGIAVDQNGDLYVVECLASLHATAAGSSAVLASIPTDRPAVQKLRRC
jgi:DNA-binding beta-propeller fold protein YncE